MPVDIREHPDAPPVTELQDLTLVPVAREEIESRTAEGETLEERNLREVREDVYVELEPDPTDRGTHDDVGTALYRLVQLFGTPQFPGYEAGGNVSDREDTTFKYLFRVVVRPDESDDGTEGESDGEDRALPDEWLVTLYDWHVELGVSTAAWSGDDVDPASYGDAVELVSLALATNVVTEPVQCEFEGRWY